MKMLADGACGAMTMALLKVPDTSEKMTSSTALLYQLGMAFPSWAGVILAVYTLFLTKSSELRTRVR